MRKMFGCAFFYNLSPYCTVGGVYRGGINPCVYPKVGDIDGIEGAIADVYIYLSHFYVGDVVHYFCFYCRGFQ